MEAASGVPMRPMLPASDGNRGGNFWREMESASVLHTVTQEEEESALTKANELLHLKQYEEAAACFAVVLQAR